MTIPDNFTGSYRKSIKEKFIHDINEILLKVALNTIKSTKPVKLSQMKGQGVLLQMLKYMYMYPEINFFLLQELKRRIGGDSGLDNSKSGGIILDTKPVGEQNYIPLETK
jgi:hypothetical protein